MNKKSIDIVAGAFSLLLSIVFIIIALTNNSFFEWMFNRHQNQLSWYIRPLFLIPFCFFSYKRSYAGIGLTILALLTSMFWFPAPEAVSDKVRDFLAMEMAYLHGTWNFSRVIFTLAIPLTFFALANALWKRAVKNGLFVVVLMAFLKIVWSIMEGGESGTSILVPAVTGLLICLVLIFFGFRMMEKRKMNSKKELV